MNPPTTNFLQNTIIFSNGSHRQNTRKENGQTGSGTNHSSRRHQLGPMDDASQFPHRAPVSHVDTTSDQEVSQLTQQGRAFVLVQPSQLSHSSGDTLRPASQMIQGRPSSRMSHSSSNGQILPSRSSPHDGGRDHHFENGHGGDSKNEDELKLCIGNLDDGFGFVTMATQSSAEEAIRRMDQAQLDGRMIYVNESRPYEDDVENFINDFYEGDDGLVKPWQRTATTTQENIPTDFDGVHNDFILKRLKELKPELLADLNLKSFYKSYSVWQKLTDDQKNKTVSYFRKLPLQLRGKYLFLAVRNGQH